MPRLDTATDAELIAALGRKDAWWRETAQRLLVERAAPTAMPGLRAIVGEPSHPGRLNAFWILDALGELSDDLLLTALDDRSVSLRLNALEAVAPRLASGNEKLVAAVLAAAHARQPEVRRMAAVVIGELPDTIALPALVRLAQRDGALPGMADAIVSGLAGRELAWLQAVAATDTGEASSVIAHATGIVIARPTPAEVEGLFQLIDNAPADSLFVSAALDAFERVTTGHRNAMARLQLPVEPTALQHYAARATPQERAQLRSLPIEQRPNRPLHFYGNTVRRMQYRNAQPGLRIPPSRGAVQPALRPAWR